MQNWKSVSTMAESSVNRRGVIGIIWQDSRLLVIERSSRVERAPGKFCFPGGTIELGESPREALLREMREELSLVVQPIKSVWQNVTASGVQLDWWLTMIDQAAQIVPNPDEVASFDWLTLDEMLALELLLPTNRDFVHAVRRGEIDAPQSWLVDAN